MRYVLDADQGHAAPTVCAMMCCVLLSIEGVLCVLETGVVLYALEMLESMRCMLLCMLEAVEGELCFVLEVIPWVLFCTLEAAEGKFCLLEVWEVPEAMRCVLLCMLVAVESALCLRRCRRCRK